MFGNFANSQLFICPKWVYFLTMFTEEKLYQVALTLTEGIGDITTRQLISHFGTAKSVLQANVGKLVKIPGIKEATARKILSKEALERAEKQLKTAELTKTELIFYLDSYYPERLKRNYDSPALLYYQGNVDLNSTKILAIVGTRTATEYGRKTTEAIVEGLQNQNILIVSGLAYGIDIFAHKAALKFNIPNIAVMASGLDIIYPKVHKKTAEALTENGGLLVEQPFGMEPNPKFFPARNRIIAGMSDATIVVEASAKGGALITAEFANNYHKDVFAVPGNLGNSFSEGCNKLIRTNKAQIFTSIQDTIEAMSWDLNSPIKTNTHIGLDLAQFTDDEAQVLSILQNTKDIQIDDLAWKTQLHVAKLSSILLNLEFQGLVKSMAGKKYGLA
jgi:DNA processing protein